jgi:hypothetical protein
MTSLDGIPFGLTRRQRAIGAALFFAVVVLLIGALALSSVSFDIQRWEPFHHSPGLSPFTTLDIEGLTDVPYPSSPETPTEASADTHGTSITYKPKEQPHPAVVASAPALSDAECAAWIIAYESGGNPWAENGRFKGIGQLDEGYYPRYIGRTWDEVVGDYDAQYQAMEGYVMDRYGSWAAAYAHARNVGWY